MAKNTLKDVPADQVQGVVDMFEALGWAVEKTKQPDGKWTIVATKPD